MMNETPSVTSTWPCTLPASWRRMKRSNMMPTSADAEAGAEHREPEIAAEVGDGRAEIGAEHEEAAMREIGNAHQAEGEREAGREQEQQAAEGDAVQRLDDPELHLLTSLAREAGRGCRTSEAKCGG